jgi:hypothetical protein
MITLHQSSTSACHEVCGGPPWTRLLRPILLLTQGEGPLGEKGNEKVIMDRISPTGYKLRWSLGCRVKFPRVRRARSANKAFVLRAPPCP